MKWRPHVPRLAFEAPQTPSIPSTLAEACVDMLAQRPALLTRNVVAEMDFDIARRVFNRLVTRQHDSVELWLVFHRYHPKIAGEITTYVAADELADIHSQLLGMSVPIPPHLASTYTLQCPLELSSALILSITMLPKLKILDLSSGRWPAETDAVHVQATLQRALTGALKGTRMIALPPIPSRLKRLAVSLAKVWPPSVKAVSPVCPKGWIRARPHLNLGLCVHFVTRSGGIGLKMDQSEPVWYVRRN